GAGAPYRRADLDPGVAGRAPGRGLGDRRLAPLGEVAGQNRVSRGHQKNEKVADMAARDVLIVEEDRKLREVLHQVFLSAGYNCLLAGDGHEGLEVFRRSHPALIVSDLNLPVMSGMELLKQARQEVLDTAVIIVSSVSVVHDDKTFGVVDVKT